MLVPDRELAASIKALVSAEGNKPVSGKLGISQQTLAAVVRGEPLRRSTWERIRAALAIELQNQRSQSRCRCIICGCSSKLERCWQCERRAGRSCRVCGHRHRDELSASLCCLYTPDVDGWCAWCGESSEKPFCGKPCSIAYHSDVSKGLFGEAMVRDCSDGDFSSSSWGS